MKPKIGVGITTYNNEKYFETLYNSLPFDKIDECVVVNGGERYKHTFYQDSVDWIQHHKNRFPSVCRNDCVSFLMERKCDYIFIIEDDMIIQDSDVFDRYIQASLNTGLKYIGYVGSSPGSGSIGNRTPITSVDYGNGTVLSLYPNMSNEFTMHHRSCFEKSGLYDTTFKNIFDVDLVYRESSKGEYTSLFWWFADVKGSDEWVINNPETISRLGPDREKDLRWEYESFVKKHGLYIHNIPRESQTKALENLKNIYNMNCK